MKSQEIPWLLVCWWPSGRKYTMRTLPTVAKSQPLWCFTVKRGEEEEEDGHEEPVFPPTSVLLGIVPPLPTPPPPLTREDSWLQLVGPPQKGKQESKPSSLGRSSGLEGLGQAHQVPRCYIGKEEGYLHPTVLTPQNSQPPRGRMKGKGPPPPSPGVPSFHSACDQTF